MSAKVSRGFCKKKLSNHEFCMHFRTDVFELGNRKIKRAQSMDNGSSLERTPSNGRPLSYVETEVIDSFA